MKAPVYITVGPQCSGKTTYLSELDGIIDISLDNVGSTYKVMNVCDLFEDIVKPRGIDLRKYSDNAETVWLCLLFNDVR